MSRHTVAVSADVRERAYHYYRLPAQCGDFITLKVVDASTLEDMTIGFNVASECLTEIVVNQKSYVPSTLANMKLYYDAEAKEQRLLVQFVTTPQPLLVVIDY